MVSLVMSHPSRSSITKKLVVGALIGLFINGIFVLPGFTQTQSWGYKAQEQSQAASSAGLTLLTKGSVDQAISSLLEATRLDANDPLPYALLGLALDMKGRYGEANDALHKSYNLNPKLSETVLSIAITHYLTHNYNKSINALREVLKLNPNLCHIYAAMGYAYLRQADLAHASDCFRRLINCYPNSQVAYQGLSTVKYLMGDFTGARQAADQSQTIFVYPPAVLLLAKLDFLTGDRSRAQRHVQEYIKLTSKPRAERPMTSIGYAAQHDFRWDPFLADCYDNAFLLQARTLNLPRDASRQRSLSRAGKAEQSIHKANLALAGVPEDFYIKRELGLLHLAHGDYSDAAAEFKEALKLCPECHVDLLHLGRALSLDGKSAEASYFVRKFQQKYPSAQLAPVFTEIARVDPGLSETSSDSNTAPGSDAEPESTSPQQPGF